MRILLVFLSFSICTKVLAVDGNLKTPNVSANALFLYQNSNFHQADADVTNPDQNPNGFNLQETEIQMYSDVDPYSRLKILLAIHPEYESNGTSIEEKWVLEPEELFIESTSFSNVTFKIGKFKALFGKQNMLHPHAYPFVQASLVNVGLLGDEGLVDAGISAAILLPSTWFNELTLQILRGDGENTEFSSPVPNDNVNLAHWKNLIDLSEALTGELGVSYATGTNSFKGSTTLSGVDLTFKWRPNEGGLYQSIIFSTEYLARRQSQKGTGVDDEQASGVVSFLRYQFAERWAALYRYDNLNVEKTFDPTSFTDGLTERNSLALTYMPSEFSSFKFEYNQRHGGLANSSGSNNEKTVFLQANFTIGSHPAHSY